MKMSTIAFAATLLLAGAAQAAPVRNVVLVHGLYADGSSWSEVIPHLQAAGLHVTSVQNPLTSLDDDVAAVQRVLALQDGPTVLVGHSYAGTVISQVGTDPKVAALVYVAARAPDAGEDYGALAAKFPATPIGKGLEKSGGFVQVSEEAFLRDFANDVPVIKARALYAVQGRAAESLGTARTTVAAWHTKPTWYAVSTQDRTTNSDLQRFLAKRMGAHTIEVASGHVSMISHPAEIAQLILDAVAAQK
ncbi:alpha/beta fold hydrolase [Burkholderia sp. LMU1-1-1.1]|uniref:alpha/beta fold hydrolase n=1 Tax=Burkholderia sp. LMU1-1-1.1 TaxID=3135266 RepID=UPI00342DA3CC